MEELFLKRPGAPPLSRALAARVLAPLCKCDLPRLLPKHGNIGVNKAVHHALKEAGITLYLSYVRGPVGREEIVIVLPEGVTSWPIKQLLPAVADFMEISAY